MKNLIFNKYLGEGQFSVTIVEVDTPINNIAVGKVVKYKEHYYSVITVGDESITLSDNGVSQETLEASFNG